MMRRPVLVGLAMVAVPTLGFAGCGGDDQPEVLRLAGPAGGAAASLAHGGGAGDEKMIAPWGEITYEVVGELPTLGGTGRAWRLTGRVTDEDVTRLARLLGVEGGVRRVEGGFEAGSYETRFLTVSTGPAPSFGFGDAAAAQVAVSCAEPVAPSGEGTRADCAEPPPLTGLPSPDEARVRALALLEEAGAFIDDAEATVDASPYGVFVSVVPRVDGIAVPDLAGSVTFGEQATVTSVYGWLARPEAADEYPLIDVPTAIDLLRSGESFGPLLATRSATTGEAVPPDQPVATDEPAVTAGAGEGSDAAEPGSAGTELVPGLTPPPEPMPEPMPEPFVVRITGVERTLVFFADADGGVWLLPGYRFISEDGGWWPVLAVDRSFVRAAG